MKILKILAIFWLFTASLVAENFMLLQTYKGDENLTGWVMSEKFDGIRTMWDGKNLITRSGKILNTPKLWSENLPPFKIDGELFTKRGDFENLSSIVRDKIPNEKAWQSVKFMIFDVPCQKENLFSRLEILENFLAKNPNKFIKIITQKKAINHENVQKFLNEILSAGGEGVVIRNPNAPYKTGRNSQILKLKKFYDSECKIIKILKGKGKNSAKMGALLCKDLKNGEIFKIGSGFSDGLRENPPKIGTIITYKFQNLTKNNKPRFPIFLRFRDEF